MSGSAAGGGRSGSRLADRRGLVRQADAGGGVVADVRRQVEGLAVELHRDAGSVAEEQRVRQATAQHLMIAGLHRAGQQQAAVGILDPHPGAGAEIQHQDRAGSRVDGVIIVLGLVGVGLALYQLWYLAIVGGRMSRQLGDIEAPQPDNPLGRVLACFKDDACDHDPEVLETRVSEAVLRELPRIERFQSFLSMVVAAGPLLGLVGTVTGMIITFQVITEVGAGDPKVMAGGISQAMIATVLGLMIAIPILFINSVLGARSKVLVQILDEQAAGLLARRLEARQQSARP